MGKTLRMEENALIPQVRSELAQSSHVSVMEEAEGWCQLCVERENMRLPTSLQ